MNLKKSWPILLIFFVVGLIYFPSFSNFFSGDDWFHLRISQISTPNEFLNFFSFAHTPQTASFYRPLPTQVFFFVFQTLFGLNPAPYHIFVFLSFLLSLYLVFLFVKEIGKDIRVAQLATLIYGISSTNLTRIYFLSAFQEISLAVFGLLYLLSYLKKKNYAIIFLVLALMSKETAVVLPIIAVLCDLFKNKFSRKILPSVLILLPYLYLRFFVFNAVQGDSYTWNFSPIKATNTLMWYTFWSFGAPEFLVDYIGSGLIPIARFYHDFSGIWPFIIFPLIILLVNFAYLFVINFRKINKLIYFGIIFFVASLLPVLFLPNHKFALELALPLIGFSFSLALLLPKKINGYLVIGLLVFYNIFTIIISTPVHYSVTRSAIAQNIYKFISKNYPEKPENSYFEFVNDAADFGSDWGQSKQINQILSGSDFFKVIYKTNDTQAFYEDIKTERPSSKSVIKLSTRQFLNQ